MARSSLVWTHCFVTLSRHGTMLRCTKIAARAQTFSLQGYGTQAGIASGTGLATVRMNTVSHGPSAIAQSRA